MYWDCRVPCETVLWTVHRQSLRINRQRPALNHHFKRDLACIERHHLARVRVACKDHYRGVRWEGRVEPHEGVAQRHLCSGECSWRGFCRRGHDGRIRRRFRHSPGRP